MARKKSLSELIRDVNEVDVDNVDKTVIKKLYLDVVYRCLEEDTNPKAMEVALRAIGQLAATLDEDVSSNLDDELRSRMPDNVLKIVKQAGEE